MARSKARPKRAAEEFARTLQDNDFGAQSSKKPRFDVRNPSALAPDALEEDATLEADVIGKRGQQVRRKAVNVDGYDSDSENENFDARAEAREKQSKAASKSQAEEETDMFADLEEDFKDGDDSEADDKRRGPGRKAVRFLDADEIEGQVNSSKSGGHVSADLTMNSQEKGKKKADYESSTDSEDDIDDEIRASTGDLDQELGAGSKKKHAPKLDAFNMKTENEEGRFDDQGNYVRKAIDPDAVHDTWLEGVSRKEMRRAKEAHDQREHQRRERDIKDDSQTDGDILKRLIPLLEQGETVLEALARLGRSQGKKSKWQKKKHGKGLNSSDGDTHMSEEDYAELLRKHAIESITEAADMLLTRGQTEIYEAEKELLARQYRRETGEEWVEPTGRAEMSSETSAAISKMWEYRWSDARDGGDIHGPYDGPTMKQWNDAGYFGEEVEFRQPGMNEPWSRLAEFI